MKQFHLTSSLALISLFIISCTSPQKAIDKGKYTKAMNIAARKIEKGKNVTQNQYHLQTAASAIADQTLQTYYAKSDATVDDWKLSQTRFNRVLSIIGKNNIKTQGMISDSYDKLCATKYDLDLKIVDYYYQEGIYLLDESIASGQTKLARNAYHEFELSEKEGAHHFYHDLEKLKVDCIYHGSIDVIAPLDYKANSAFINKLPPTSSETADCRITIDYGRTSISEDYNTSRKSHKKEILVGQNCIRDTSGNVTYEDILEEVTAYENINEITYTARQRISINVEELTSQCFLKSRTVNLCETEVCTETSFSGDLRAVTTVCNSSCSASSLRSDVSNDINRSVNRNLYASHKIE